jgi:uncharacterized protein
MKYLLVILVVAVVLWFALRRTDRKRTSRRGAPPPTLTMVRCAQCGVHLPASEAVAEGELRFCSVAHRALGPTRQ